MTGMVKYLRLNDQPSFDSLQAPALIRYQPGSIRICVDAREISAKPALLPTLNETSDALIAGLTHTTERHDTISLGCRVHRVRHVPGGRLLAAEVVDGVAHIEIHRTLMSDDLAAALGALGDNMGRYLV